MIVRRESDGSQLLITQPAHAHLARQVMESCVRLAEHPRRATILRAVAEHDGGWEAEDDAPEFDMGTGGVVDFICIAVQVRQRVWPRAVANLADDPWAAALVAQHAMTAYDRYRADAEWAPFFAAMEASREAMLARSDVGREQLVEDYVFLRLADLISLCFCTGISEEQRIGQWSVQLVTPTVFVAPDPFGGREIPVEISATRIQPQRIRSSADLRKELDRGERVTLRGTVMARLVSPDGPLLSAT